ncbi:MAG TPA: hypothetical protein VFH51_20740, partial [Myxococcota bacterium]|nr:hypothetical protein [Myxococcota bacterium]
MAAARRWQAAVLFTLSGGIAGCGGPVQDGFRPAFAPPRHGVFQDPTPIVASTEDDLLPTVAPRQGLIAYASRAEGNLDIVVRPLAGGPTQRLTTHSTDDSDPAFSPDGTRLAWISQADDVKGDVWVMNADGSNKRRLTGAEAADSGPTWGPDNRTIFFTSRPAGSPTRRVERVDATDGARGVVLDPGWDASVSPDGEVVFYVRTDENQQPRVFARRLRDGAEVPLTHGASVEGMPHAAATAEGTVVVFSRYVDDH